jgi:hypothetical protein
MPSQHHEVLLELFRNNPRLAAVLLRDVWQVPLPAFTAVHTDSVDFTQVQPTEYRADLVVRVLDEKPVLGIVVEVQLAVDEGKLWSWPVYVASLRARLKCPVCLLVVSADETTARWAAKPIDLGGSSVLTPFVLGPSAVPVITSPARARADPELAVLSAMAHGRDQDSELAARIAQAARTAILQFDDEDERARLYFDVIINGLSEPARRALQTMTIANYEYQSDFARKYMAQGVKQGHANLLRRQLTLRFGPLPQAAQARLASASIEQLDAMGERLLSADTLQDVLDAAQ